jgi:hypothetical protein
MTLAVAVRESNRISVLIGDGIDPRVCPASDSPAELIETINGKGAAIHFRKEGLIFNGSDNPMQKMQLQIMGSVASSSAR